MPEPTDLILPMLREMRTAIATLGTENSQRHAILVARLVKIEETQMSFKHALTADTLMGKLVTGEFETRLAALEAEVRALKAAR